MHIECRYNESESSSWPQIFFFTHVESRNKIYTHLGSTVHLKRRSHAGRDSRSEGGGTDDSKECNNELEHIKLKAARDDIEIMSSLRQLHLLNLSVYVLRYVQRCSVNDHFFFAAELAMATRKGDVLR